MPRKPASTRPDESNEANESTGSTDTTEPTAPAGSQPADDAGPTPPPAPGSRFFSWLRTIDIRREQGWIGGVCAGIATRLGIDPLIVRGIAVVVAVLGGPAILLYAAAWLLLPDASDRIHLEDVFRGRFEPVIAAIGGLFVLAMLPVAQGFWFLGAGYWGAPDWGGSLGRALWTVALVGLLVWLIVWIARRSSSDEAAPPDGQRPASGMPRAPRPASAAFVASDSTVTPPADSPDMSAWREQQAQVRAEQEAFRGQQAADRAAANRAAALKAQEERTANRERYLAQYAATRSHPLFSLVVIGLALVAGGLAVVVTSTGEPTLTSLVIGLAASLAVLAVGIIINGVLGKRAGGASGAAWVLLVPLFFTSFATAGGNTQLQWGPVLTLEPTSSESYTVGAGRIDLDLTTLDLDDQGQDVSLRVGAGSITVIVPDGARVLFDGTVAAGAITAGPGERSSRVGPVENSSAVFGEPGEPSITVSVQLGAGNIRVVEEGDNR